MKPEIREAALAVVRQLKRDDVSNKIYGLQKGSSALTAWPTSPTRIVFLDIDGVLNSEQSRDELGSLVEFSKRAVANLNQLLSSTDALLVISSSWRIDWTLEEIARHLSRQGVLSPKIVGKTPDLPDKPRGHEIQAWLDEAPFPVESFVILDDRDDLHPNRHRHVQTDPAEGLTAHDAYRATSLLLKPG